MYMLRQCQHHTVVPSTGCGCPDTYVATWQRPLPERLRAGGIDCGKPADRELAQLRLPYVRKETV